MWVYKIQEVIKKLQCFKQFTLQGMLKISKDCSADKSKFFGSDPST
jgi:hypothetical protein